MDEGTTFWIEIEAGGPDPIRVEALLVHWRHLRPEEDGEAEATMGYGVRLTPPTPQFWGLVSACESLAAAAS